MAKNNGIALRLIVMVLNTRHTAYLVAKAED